MKDLLEEVTVRTAEYQSLDDLVRADNFKSRPRGERFHLRVQRRTASRRAVRAVSSAVGHGIAADNIRKAVTGVGSGRRS